MASIPGTVVAVVIFLSEYLISYHLVLIFWPSVRIWDLISIWQLLIRETLMGSKT